MDKMASTVPQVTQVNKGRPDPQEREVCQVCPALKENGVPQAPRDPQDLQDLRERGEHQVFPVFLVGPVSQEPPVKMAPVERRDSQAALDLTDLKVPWVFPVLLDQEGRQVFPGRTEHAENQDLPETTAWTVHQENRAPRVNPAPRG